MASDPDYEPLKLSTDDLVGPRLGAPELRVPRHARSLPLHPIVHEVDWSNPYGPFVNELETLAHEIIDAVVTSEPSYADQLHEFTRFLVMTLRDGSSTGWARIQTAGVDPFGDGMQVRNLRITFDPELRFGWDSARYGRRGGDLAVISHIRDLVTGDPREFSDGRDDAFRAAYELRDGLSYCWNENNAVDIDMPAGGYIHPAAAAAFNNVALDLAARVRTVRP